MNYIKQILFKLGFSLTKISSIKAESGDPRELPYLVTLPYSEIELPIERGVGLKFYPLSGKTHHPFIVGLRYLNAKKNKRKTLKKILAEYAKLVNFSSGNSTLGLTNGPFTSINSNLYTYPWSILSPTRREEIHSRIIKEENLRFNFESDEFLESPLVSSKKVKVESKRLLKLFKSISKNGYKSQYKDALNCFILMDGNNWKWFVESGQHRVSVLSVIGYTKVPVHVRMIVRREEVSVWPGVRRGIFSEKEALDVFDNMLNQITPPAAYEWVNYVEDLKL